MLLVYVLLAKQPNKQLNICVKLRGGGHTPNLDKPPPPKKNPFFHFFKVPVCTFKNSHLFINLTPK